MIRQGDIGHFHIELEDDETFWLEMLVKDLRTTLYEMQIEDDRKVLFLALELAYKRGRYEQWKDSRILFPNTELQ